MERVYFDNAATTAIDPKVLEEMLPYLSNHFGNPSSIHAHGRQVRTAIERSRKKVADLLNVSPAEIFFTSGGTEADNTALRCTVKDKGIKHLISTKLEHHAVLHCLDLLENDGIKVTYLNLDGKGVIDYDQLESLLKDSKDTMVSLMHGNNEIGNLCDLERVAEMCREYGAFFHSDTVQTMAHYVHDLGKLDLDFAVGSAHKFHGPKGTGFLYVNHKNRIAPFIQGGSQERNMRGGTENVYGIVGLAKAMEMAYSEMDEHRKHIEHIKSHTIDKVKSSIDGVAFNGMSGEVDKSLYTVLNICLPPSDDNDMLLFNLDINGVSASGGSACTSGSKVGSHVIAELDRDQRRGVVRFSFSRNNTIEEANYAVEKLAALYN